LCTVASGTCLTQTAIFIGADSIGGTAGAPTRSGGVSGEVRRPIPC